MDIPNDPDNIPLYIGAEIHDRLERLFSRDNPQHAWVRYLGYRMIEEVSVIIDGEEIDSHNDDLLLFLHKMLDTPEHERGINIMIGHMPEMYTVSRELRPSVRLYVQFRFWFGKDYGNSMPLLNMIYSDVRLKIKLRSFEDLFYMERYAELKRPVKIKCHLLGDYIYLGDEERKSVATTRSQSIMERFNYSGTLVKKVKNIKNNVMAEDGVISNVIRVKYNYTDPCKYLIWKVELKFFFDQDINKLYWDLANYRVRNKKGEIDLTSKIKDIVIRTLITFNGNEREKWKDNTYFQTLQPLNKKVNPLDSGEYMYGMCLFPRELQPSGATNFSEIEDVSFFFEINPDIIKQLEQRNIMIKIKMWECSYNLFIAMSGFGALGFYGTKH